MARDDKWLLRKASGSRRHLHDNGRYAFDRNTKNRHGEELPHNEGFKHASTSMNTDLIKRWLYSKVGVDFDGIYSEFVSRVQPKFQAQYLESIYWYVNARNDTQMDAEGFAHHVTPNYFGDTMLPTTQQVSFYIHPDSNLLCVITDAQKKKVKDVRREYHNKQRIEQGLPPQ